MSLAGTFPASLTQTSQALTPHLEVSPSYKHICKLKSSVAWCSDPEIQHAQHNSTGIAPLLGGQFSLSYRSVCLVVVLAVNIMEISMPSTGFMSVDP